MQNFILQYIKHIHILNVSKQIITGLQIYKFIYFSLLEVDMCEKGQVCHSLVAELRRQHCGINSFLPPLWITQELKSSDHVYMMVMTTLLPVGTFY